ncbi:choline/carnitine O-acyltransferase [Shewanella gelidimarina]|uniref:choline/carnitine O-acyltransferase n=1 Tax=Shewanella gelidimarina TaxID=56813 RepID=UPI0020107B56|nr:choline/carnitine O-acyltransferase [Shewanella gelidimarina]MCL1060102.1 choline/carnitine O-acyltransferase [Shewanella gelidimarina]
MLGNTFSCQKELPVMPVPDLNIACRKLIEWSEPLLTEQESTKTKQVIEQFLQPGGDGEKLQNELIEWAQQPSIGNWFAPVWRDFYLACPKSLVINSNVFYYLKSKLDETTHSQANIAAALISCVYHFIALIDKKELSVDRQKNLPLCMNQYRHLFSSTRIPHQGTDEFKTSSSRKHLVIMHHQRIYKLDIIDDNGNILSPSAIEFELNCILSPSEQGQNLGMLSSMLRDQWATSRADLLQISADNKKAMTAVEEAAFVLCLDEKSPQEITEVSKQLLHGAGQDRFFDKSLQFIVFKNGKTGINFEHTGVDGSVMLRLIEHVYDTIDKVSFDQSPVPLQTEQAACPNVKEIEFDLNDALRQTISTAVDSFKQHTANTQTRVLNFTQFGKNQIKQLGVSPDAFVQLALQLAEYKIYGKCYSAYEAVMTRTFLDGRLDALHTVSHESMAFIHNICNADCSAQTKIDSLIKAAQKHVERAKECRLGLGIYSHFMALQYRYKEAGSDIGIDKLPEIFTDKGYQALTHSVVCTSTTSDYGVELAGYGPLVDDGYGIRYFTRSDSICFNMTSRSAMQGKLEQMQINIEQSLLEMATLMHR